ncbi:MAG TPA: thiamine phosphate synthase [Anaeromyxobacteraceae bacterium]|nr:thiamine phosphate synthase [Anaeromyxobacteraceae bacterium]
MMPRVLPHVYLVTDAEAGADLVARVEAALRGLPREAVAVQLRAKEEGGRALLAAARALRRVTEESGQLLVVNDRLDVALLAEADGVHLPSHGVPPAAARRLLGSGRLVGVSCHSAADVLRARQGGADFATFGPVFPTPSKLRYGPPVGLERLREAAATGLPVLGLGGVDVARAPEVMAAGAYGVAAIRAWLVAGDPGAAVRGLLAATGTGDGTSRDRGR